MEKVYKHPRVEKTHLPSSTALGAGVPGELPRAT
jgi:hypothetical protein